MFTRGVSPYAWSQEGSLDVRTDVGARLPAMWSLMGTEAGKTAFRPGTDPRVGMLMQEALVEANTVDAADWTIASDVALPGRPGNELLVQHHATPEPNGQTGSRPPGWFTPPR